MADPVHDAASPEMAWQNGAAAAASGDQGLALQWLQRAVRLAPDDPRIALDLANIRLGVGGAAEIARAAAAFELLISRYDVAAGWLGLMAARRLAGDHAAAAEALRQLLSRYCVPQEPGFAEVALRVARAAGKPGYCGIDPASRLHIVAADAVSCTLDGLPVRLRHLDRAPGKLRVRVGDAELLGSPLDPAAMRRVEGMVEDTGAGLIGWATRPAAPLQPPQLYLTDVTGLRRLIPMADILPADNAAPLTARHRFECSATMLRGLTPPLRLSGADGDDILGSPIDPEAVAASVPAAFLGPAMTITPQPAKLAVVVPVYRGLAVTQVCLTALLAALPAGARLIVVDDATPDPALAGWLGGWATRHRVSLIRHDRNRGFPAAANAGLRAAAGCDVLLLNSDALVPPGAIETLLAAVYARPEIGSATPFSNEATLLSYPRSEGGNPAPDLAGTTALQRLAAASPAAIEIPTGVGFCMLMRHDCLHATGGLRTDLFAQGYGEENDWCLRARHLGFRHVAASAYVAHHGGVSFGAAGRALNMRNYRLLGRLHPGYDAMIRGFMRADLLAGPRRQLDLARFEAGRKADAVLLISHNHGGGVGRRVALEMQHIRANGQRPILLCPALSPSRNDFPWPAQLTDDAPGDYPNLHFVLPRDEAALLRLLRAEGTHQVVLHHGLGHHAAIRGIAERLGCVLDIVLHDYASFCPRVHLVGAEQRYCGEPDRHGCAVCVAQAGDETLEHLGPQRLAMRSAQEFAGARQISAPSADTARRIARHFPGVLPDVTPWEDDTAAVELRPPRDGHRRIAIIGGIGIAKGYQVLLDCARDANQRNLPIEYLIAGSSSGDARLLETGRFFITGAYQPAEAETVIAGLHADLAFIPSIWPETWCFTLSEAWRAGLYTLAFDLGAQGERITASGRGAVLPLGLPAPRINDILLSWRPKIIRAKPAPRV